MLFPGLLCVLVEARKALPTAKNNPYMYMLLGVRFVLAAMKILQIEKYWIDQQDLAEIINFVLQNKNDIVFPRAHSHTVKLFQMPKYGNVMVIILCFLNIAAATETWFAGRINSIERIFSEPTAPW